jgi:hypothetical protein
LAGDSGFDQVSAQEQEFGYPFAVEDTDSVLPVESGGGGKIGKEPGFFCLCPGSPAPDSKLPGDWFFSFIDNPISPSGR